MTMLSFNKTKLTDEKIQRVVAQAFGQRASAYQQLLDGWANRHVRLRFGMAGLRF